MGLAAKMAAAGGAYAVSNAGTNQYQQHQQAGAAPAQVPGQYGAPPPGQYGAPPPGQYGAPPPGQYGAQAPAQRPQDASAFAGIISQKLHAIVAANGLQPLFPAAALDHVIRRAQGVDFRALAAKYNMPVELALDFVVLALYDVTVMCDDSASMKFAEKGTRIDDLKAIIERVTSVTTLFDSDGISLRAMNLPDQQDGVTDSAQAAAYVQQLKYNAGTPMGHSMEDKVLKPLLHRKLKDRTLRKPLLVITITDGEPTGEREDKIRSVIKDAKKACKNSHVGEGAVAFEFAQVGRDEGAQRFLAKLDNDKDVGKLVDCTSYYELEQQEYARKGVLLTPDTWMLKLLVGAVDRSYDEQD